MKNERILAPSVFVLIALLHIGLVSVLWRAALPEQGALEHIEFIDLGDLGGGDGQAVTAPAAAIPPPPPPPETPKPKVTEPVKPVIKPVVTRNERADIRQREEKPKEVEQVKPQPKPEPQPERKPEEQVRPQPQQTPAQSGQQRAANEGRGTNTAEGRGSGRGEGSGGSSGGGGSGAGGGTGAGSSAGNAIQATGSIPRPPYPPLSLENGEEGTVVLKVMVAPNGSVSNVRVAKSSGSKRLDRAASQAARGGRFQPKGWTEYTIPVAFRID